MMARMTSMVADASPYPDIPDHVLMQWQRLCLLAVKATGAAAVHVIETSGSNLVTRAAAGERAGELSVIASDCDRAVVAEREPLVLEDTAGSPRGLAAAAGGAGAYIGLPLFWPDGKVFGALAGVYERPRLYSSSDHEVFVVTAAALAHDLALLAGGAREAGAAAQVPRSSEGSGAATDFFASIVHELRTPLVSILGASEAMLGGMSGRVTESQQRLLEIIGRGGDRMVRLVDNLRELVRAESGRFSLTVHPLDLREPVRQAMAALRPLAENAGVQLIGDLPASEVAIRGDVDRLVQVATNLVENAIRHARRTVRVQVRSDDEATELIVADDGPGVPADQAEALFAPWRRGGAEPGGSTTHLGLGLTIVRHLVEAHGGTVRAVSPPPADLAAGPASSGFACVARFPTSR